MSELFSVSIKGVLFYNGKYLLRKNQRNEYELIGGRLEKNDKSPEQRLITEFIEESGVEIAIETFYEPWLYIISEKNIIIVPYVCKAIRIPEKLIDQDGGEIFWVASSELHNIPIPAGYIDSIYNRIPGKSFSSAQGDYFKIIPDYTEQGYRILIQLADVDGSVVLCDYLDPFTAPRDFIQVKTKCKFNNEDIIARPISKRNEDIVLNYLLINKHL